MKKIFMKLILLVILLGLSGCVKNKNFDNYENILKLPVEYTAPIYIYNVNDPKEQVGFMDYVFVGEVIAFDGTTYENLNIEDEEDHYMAFSNYTISVKENIKGNLTINTSIAVQKEGGVSQIGDSVSLDEDDFLPEIGSVYIFSTIAREDGSLFMSGKNSNIYLYKNSRLTRSKSEFENIKENGIYEDYVEASKNQIESPYKGEEYLSIYDEQLIE